MKRRALISHLSQQGCELVREGGNHSWWGHHVTKRRSAVPRHAEIHDLLVKTNAVRLRIESSDAPCGIQEWSVN